MSFEIRDGSIDDLNELYLVEKSSFLHPWKEKDMVYELTENPVTHYLVVENEDGHIIAFIDYWITFDSSTIAQIATLPEFRRQGLAKALLEEMMKDLFAKRVMTVTLEVRTHNIAAINLYRKCGFEGVVTKPHYYENGDDALYMMRKVEL